MEVWGTVPNQESPLIYLVLRAGEVVGMRGMHGARWQVGGAAGTVDVVCAGDMVVVPAHQNRGLFRQINEAAMHDLAALGHRFVFNFSAAPVTFLRSLRSGWRLVGAYRTVARPPGKLATRHVDRLRRAEPKIAREAAARAAAMANLNRRLDGPPGQRGRIGHVRDSDYYAWRFSNPLSTYSFLYSGLQTGGAELDGYMVLQRSRLAQGGRINILDWVALRPDTLRDLLIVAIADNHASAMGTWSATLSAERIDILADFAFRHFDESQGVNHYQPGVLVAATGGDEAGHAWALGGTPLLDIANWDLRMVYSDGF